MLKLLKGFVKYYRDHHGPIDLVPASAGCKIDKNTIAYYILNQKYPTFCNNPEKRLVSFVWHLYFLGVQGQKTENGIEVTPFEAVSSMFGYFESYLIQNPVQYIIDVSDQATYMPITPGDKNSFIQLAKRYTVNIEVDYSLKFPNELIRDINTTVVEVE